MQISALTDFICPVDGLPLVPHEKTLRCEKNHSFDQSAEGYWNLLLVQNKATLDPGDSKEMVSARQKFLQTGYYAPIAKELFSLVLKRAKNQPENSPLNIVDAGCGEGYYLRQLRNLAMIRPAPTQLKLAGFDISKWAIKSAAKQSKDIGWAVASNRSIPFAKNSADIIISMFGFPAWEKFRALQKDSGQVFLVDPGPDHLLELREVIYPKVEKSGPPSLREAERNGYVLEEEKRLTFSIQLESQEQIQNLLAMTPHAHRLSLEGGTALQKMPQLTITVDVIFRVLRSQILSP